MRVIKLRRGPLEHIPSLHEAELVYASDTNELYIGTAKGNTTPTFNGGTLNDATKGRFIPRHGNINQIIDLVPGELFYLEEEKSLAVALDKKRYVILNQEAIEAIKFLEQNKRDKDTKITGGDIEENQVFFQHLSPDLRKAILKIDHDPIELILAPDSINSVHLADKAVSFNNLDDELREAITAPEYDFGAY